VFDFWPQAIDEFGKWQQYPVNIGNTIKNFESLGNYTASLLHRLGLDWLADRIDSFIDTGNEYLSAFRTSTKERLSPTPDFLTHLHNRHSCRLRRYWRQCRSWSEFEEKLSESFLRLEHHQQ
jgi:hypothetical protein